MWIERSVTPRLSELASTRPAVLIVGSRQTGKSSLVRHVFPAHRYVSMEYPRLASEAEIDGISFLRQLGFPVILDEVQYAPGLFRAIKILVDEERDTNGRFILSGSQRLGLMKGASEGLTGRVGIIDLEGLSHSELEVAGLEASWTEICLKGGFPELWSKPDVDVDAFYWSYVAAYLERDVRNYISGANPRDFERLLRACAARSGQLVNKADIARDIGVSPSTCNDWLTALEASGMICYLEPWFRNIGKRLVRSPKIYIRDPGMMCFLLGIRTESELRASPYMGAVWETFLFSELRRTVMKGRPLSNLWLFRDHNREVDFLWDQGGRYILMEAKSRAEPHPRDAQSLAWLSTHLGTESIIAAKIVTPGPTSFEIVPAVRVEPWKLALQSLSSLLGGESDAA